MDVLEKVRSLRSDVEGLNSAQTAAALAYLEEVMAAEAAPTSHRRRPGVVWTVGITGTAAVAAATFVAASIGGIGPTATPGHHSVIGVAVPPANAEEVLAGAAKLASASVPPQPVPGQYLRVETDSTELRTAGPGTDGQFRRGSTASWINHATLVIYVPANRSDTWIEDNNAAPVTTSDEHGTDVAAAIAQDQKTYAKQDAESVQYLPGGLAPTGMPNGHKFALGQVAGAGVNPATIPTDPAGLLAFYRHEVDFGDPTDPDSIAIGNEMVFDLIASDLASDLLPASQRAAAFKAIALIPGVRLLSTTGTSSTLQLLDHSDDYRLTIDTATGLVTGIETFLNEPEGATQTIGAVPAGTPTSSSAVKISVVDSLPPALQAGLEKASK
ncbi:hypothetical protein ACFOYW_00015 [Gryllotalpicola reticulitermitis]|uniref:Uncharacterized protein n=1 Tax=Gryllotalpicola reticulitermitis TaxID=1184153 RepID=A0ABV8Q0F1_9MICO